MSVKIKIIKHKLNHWEGASDKAKETVAKILLLIILMFGASEIIENNRPKLVFEQGGCVSCDTIEESKPEMAEDNSSDDQVAIKPKAQEESTRLEADSHSVIATTYNAEEAQTDSDPFTMASGKRVYEGAVASNCHPLGTKLKIEGVGEVVVEDKMNSRYTKDCGTDQERIDIFKFNKADNFKKIVKYAKV
jgi:3D (Asp-Asp-Asp) domain-containing protein